MSSLQGKKVGDGPTADQSLINFRFVSLQYSNQENERLSRQYSRHPALPAFHKRSCPREEIPIRASALLICSAISGFARTVHSNLPDLADLARLALLVVEQAALRSFEDPDSAAKALLSTSTSFFIRRRGSLL